MIQRALASKGIVAYVLACVTTSNESSFARRGNETGVFAPSSSLGAESQRRCRLSSSWRLGRRT
jgi:hypothetical protein